jgi:hypothetical protein
MHLEIFIASANHRQKASGYGYVARLSTYPEQPVIGFGPASEGLLSLAEGELVAMEKGLVSVLTWWPLPTIIFRSCNPRFLQDKASYADVLNNLKLPTDGIRVEAVNGLWEYYNAAEAAAKAGSYDAYLRYHAYREGGEGNA